MRNGRRAFLGLLSGLSITVAGCLGTGDDGSDALPDHYEGTDGEDDGGEDDDRQVVPNSEVYDFPPIDDPGEAPDDMLCAACNHTPADWPESNAQVTHEDGHRQFLCSPGCLVAYREATAQYAGTDAPIVSSWARDVTSSELHELDGERFYWVIDPSPDDWRGIDPMSNPLPFLDRDDAIAYIDEWDDLSTDDLLPTSDLDREIAAKYRAVE